MRKSKFSETPIVRNYQGSRERRAHRRSAAEARCLSKATFFKWSSKFRGVTGNPRRASGSCLIGFGSKAGRGTTSECGVQVADDHR